MNILVIGSGGREHALIWKLRQSPKAKSLFCAPGNAGIAQHARLVSLKPTDLSGLLRFATENAIDLTVVGPEQPLVDGIVDEFEKALSLDPSLQNNSKIKLMAAAQKKMKAQKMQSASPRGI